MDDRDLEAVYLEEMQALERFRIAYTGTHPGVPLNREDPDVARMIEAMAFFSARSRRAASARLDDALLRLFRPTFEELLRPLPATCLVKAVPNARHVETTALPSETDLVLRQPSQTSLADDKLFRFTTLRPIRLLPATLEGVDMLRRGPLGTRISLRFESRFPRNERLGRIAIHVNHLGDFAASAQIVHSIAANILGVSVVVDERATSETVGVPCTFRIGAPTLDDARGEPIANAFERERLFFRRPEQVHYLEVEVPERIAHWRRFAICIDVGPKWPSALRLTAEMLHLGVVAAVNRVRDFAAMIDEDGTKLRHNVAPQSSQLGLRPQAILSVNRITKDGFSPLEHGSIRGAQGGWESSSSGSLKDRRVFLEVGLPGAFETPEQLAAEAIWFQPGLDDVESYELEPSLASRNVEGVGWEVVSPLTKAVASPFERDRESVLRLLGMRQQDQMRVDDLRFLLRALGADTVAAFAPFVQGLASVTTAAKPFARHASGLKHVLTIDFEGLDSSVTPFLDTFGQSLTRILRAWSATEVVEVHLQLRNLELRRSYTP
jgi:type VI secretion system protein ImpG